MAKSLKEQMMENRFEYSKSIQDEDLYARPQKSRITDEIRKEAAESSDNKYNSLKDQITEIKADYPKTKYNGSYNSQPSKSRITKNVLKEVSESADNRYSSSKTDTSEKRADYSSTKYNENYKAQSEKNKLTGEVYMDNKRKDNKSGSLKNQMMENRYDYSKSKYDENFEVQPKKSRITEEVRREAGKEVNNNIGLTSALTYVKKYYLEDLSDFNTVPPGNTVRKIVIEDSVKLFKLNGIVFNKKENILDKLNNIYGTLHSLGISLILFIINDGEKIDYYFGAKSTGNVKENVTLAFNKAFTGNFPGSQLEEVSAKEYREILNTVLPGDGSNAVSSLSCIPSLKDDDADNTEYVQGIEKLVDTMYGEKYALMVISNPVGESYLEEVKQGYEELYSELFSLADYELTLGSSDAQSVSESELEGYTKTIGKSISKTQSFTKGTSSARSKSRTNTIGAGFGFMGNFSSNKSGMLNGDNLFGMVISRIGGILSGTSRGISSVFGGNMFGNASKSWTEGKTNTDSHNEQRGSQEGKNESEATSIQRGTQIGSTASTSSSSTVKFEDKAIKNLLDVIEEHIKRLKDCENYGMWSTAAYFISPSRETASVSASTYKSIMNGDNTSLETSCVNSWYKDNNVKCINEYLRKFTHPSFYSKDFLIDLEASTNVTAATMISTRELSIQCGIPYKSIPGVPVREMAEFGRSVSDGADRSKKIKLGNIYHMGKRDEKTTVDLNIERLKEHTFVTGSTGSGKSNTVYNIISKLRNINIPTLVIEPAKGEYKQVFGKDFNVYGTNPEYTELLRINPFKFEKKIHVLEHIDRLIDIFNVCWPMYAAMPAVLKEAVEQAYINAGWDLDRSVNICDNNIYPCFNDVFTALRNVITHSDYSQEVKDNYTGSLITRVKSLTNGLNGRIFTSNEISSHELFEENTIIDLSRVGSSETKAMIMGIIVMRLQEYRMSKGGINLPLKHITVLEEAHNLLKRTSTEQSSETSNLLGKSVEMISNAIAEMRTYGEGFIIADQAPGLLDLSVIRNTNTKIILKLPDFSDRELVGKSAGLNDDQIVELSKIPTGVAAVYQNKWVEAVLCKIDYYDCEPTEYISKSEIQYSGNNKLLKEQIAQYLLSSVSRENPEKDVEFLKDRLINSNIEASLKIYLIKALSSKRPENIKEACEAVSKCFENVDNVFTAAKKAESVEEWNNLLINELDFEMKTMSKTCVENILDCIIRQKSTEGEVDKTKYFEWVEYIERRRIM